MRYVSGTRLLAMGALVGVLFAGTGCSWLGLGDDDSADRPQPPGAAQPYPNLATVPNKAPDAGTTRQRLQIEEGLLADRTNARHVAGPTAGEERPSSLPPEGDIGKPTIIDPRSAPPPGTTTAAANTAARPTGAIGAINYSAGSIALPEGSGRTIVRAAEAQRRFGGVVVVVGHAAKGEGDDAARQALATQRASVVAGGLLNLGVQRENIRVGTSNGRVDASRVDIALQGAR